VVRFLHTGDWQLGMTRHFLGDEAQARFTAARLDAVREIGRIAEREGCAFVVVAGDVFESNHLDRQVLLRALDALASFPVPVYLLPGNHDPLDAASVFRHADVAASPTVTVLDRAGTWPVADGAELVAAPWTSKRPLEDLLAAACRDVAADGTVRIAVGHGLADTLSPDRDDPAVIRLAGLETALADGRLHYVALGDRHSLTQVGATGRVWYAGTPEPTAFDEVAPGQVLVVDADAARCDVRAVAVATWRFVLPEPFVLRDADDVSELETWLAEQAGKDRCIVKLTLRGSLGLRDMALLDDVLDRHRELFASLRVSERRSDLALLPEDEDLASLELSGFAADAVEELRAAAAGDAAAQDALALLYRLHAGAA
jgi:DNA repair exonuclease SbcCD nuclease subunit